MTEEKKSPKKKAAKKPVAKKKAAKKPVAKKKAPVKKKAPKKPVAKKKTSTKKKAPVKKTVKKTSKSAAKKAGIPNKKKPKVTTATLIKEGAALINKTVDDLTDKIDRVTVNIEKIRKKLIEDNEDVSMLEDVTKDLNKMHQMKVKLLAYKKQCNDEMPDANKLQLMSNLEELAKMVKVFDPK